MLGMAYRTSPFFGAIQFEILDLPTDSFRPRILWTNHAHFSSLSANICIRKLKFQAVITQKCHNSTKAHLQILNFVLHPANFKYDYQCLMNRMSFTSVTSPISE